MSRLILFNKPYGVLSQFTDKGTTAPADGPRATLSDYIDVPGVYPAGRLDRDSEGLLILTDDGALQARISSPKHKMPKTYLAQVEGVPDAAALAALARGVTLNDGPTRPATVRRIDPPMLWDRVDRTDDHRRPQPPGPPHDRRGRLSDAAAGSLADREVGDWGFGVGGMEGDWTGLARRTSSSLLFAILLPAYTMTLYTGNGSKTFSSNASMWLATMLGPTFKLLGWPHPFLRLRAESKVSF